MQDFLVVFLSGLGKMSPEFRAIPVKGVRP